jgi:predicted nucleic acid-binding protein
MGYLVDTNILLRSCQPDHPMYNVHDARLVAVCLVHGLTHIVTFNDRDFRRYKEIHVIHPDKVI